MLFLVNQDPRTRFKISPFRTDRDPDHYIMVLQQPVPREEFNWFVLRQIVTTEEDVAWVIMWQATFAGQMCCQCVVFHCDIYTPECIYTINLISACFRLQT